MTVGRLGGPIPGEGVPAPRSPSRVAPPAPPLPACCGARGSMPRDSSSPVALVLRLPMGSEDAPPRNTSPPSPTSEPRRPEQGATRRRSSGPNAARKARQSSTNRRLCGSGPIGGVSSRRARNLLLGLPAGSPLAVSFDLHLGTRNAERTRRDSLVRGRVLSFFICICICICI